MGSRGQSMQKERRRAETRAVKQLTKILGGGVKSSPETAANDLDAELKNVQAELLKIAKEERAKRQEGNYTRSEQTQKRIDELAKREREILAAQDPEFSRQQEEDARERQRTRESREAVLNSDKAKANRKRAREEAERSGGNVPYYVKFLGREDKTMSDLLDSVSGMSKATILRRFPGFGLSHIHTRKEMASIIKRMLEDKGYREG